MDGLIERLEEIIGRDAVGVVGHRVVHGGPNYLKPHRVTPQLLADLRSVRPLRSRAPADPDRAHRDDPSVAARAAASGLLRYGVSRRHASRRQDAPHPAAFRCHGRAALWFPWTFKGEVMNAPLSPELLRSMDALLACRQLFVGRSDLSLRQPAPEGAAGAEHIKPRLLGHWGTTSAPNFIYVHLNRVIKDRDLNIIYVIGPGHGRPGPGGQRLPGRHLQRGLPRHLPGAEGGSRLFKQFSFPGGIPSHVAPGDARLDPRRGRAGLRAVARLRGGLRQSRPDRGLRRRRRRGRDRAAGHELALATSSSTRSATARCCRSCI